jgi:peptide/nickel transport system substrate-binding protein
MRRPGSSRAPGSQARQLALVVALAFLLGVAASCGGGGDEVAGEPPAAETGAEGAATVQATGEEEPAEGEPQPGGVYRVGIENSFNWTNAFDPTGEYLNVGFLIYSNLLLRTLLGYKHVAGAEGAELIPDLAAGLPEVSDDGLTWTFRLKDGVSFGPPVSREITSKDILYAFERIATPDLVAQYGFYYLGLIEGMQEFFDGKADTISGIETPDDKTIVFKLTQRSGDFGYRVAMPAAAPIPEEVAKCFTTAGEYGRYVVSSGPYMIEGSDALDITSCETMKPLPGYDPNTTMTLVRNPDYDPATDTPDARENFPDRFEFVINTNVDDIFDKIQAGELEGEIAPVPGPVLREYSQSDELKDRLHSDLFDATWYLSMNLTQAPFDDIHVRRAVNLVMDKEGLRRSRGGPIKGEVATHIVPNAMLADVLVDYDPYPSPDFTGDAEAAKAEMRQSKYDSDGDGICDAPECKGVLHIASTQQVFRDLVPVIEQSLGKIGITLTTRELNDYIPPVSTIAKNIPFTSALGWFKDYSDPSTFMVLFDSRSTSATGNINHSLVGLTPEQAEGFPGIEGNFEGIPSVDADIDVCTPLQDDERVQCWADLDRKLMEEVVPWVPYLWESATDIIGPAVTRYVFDQYAGEAAYAHVAVDPSKQ